MRKISTEEVKHLIKLAKLKLSEKEREKFQRQLTEIINYFNVLKKVDTSGVKPTSQVTGLENITREDQTEPGLSQKEALSGTKSTHNGYFKVKAVFNAS